MSTAANLPACSCITCSDEAIEMTVVALDAATGLATCAGPDGESSEVDLGLVDGVAIGGRVFVHAGTAIALAPELVAPGLATSDVAGARRPATERTR